MASEWFVRSGEKVFGPFTPAKMKQLASASKISPHTEVGQNSSGPWQPAEKIKGLFASDSAATPAQVTPPPLPSPAPAPASPKSAGRWYTRWWALYVVYPFLALFALGTVIQIVVPKETLDRWKAEAAERSRVQAEATSKKNEGFTAGFMTGAVAAREGLRQPTSAEINAAARRAATNANVSEEDRSYWIYQYELGFPMGWKKGQ